jgi:hypothetical protein
MTNDEYEDAFDELVYRLQPPVDPALWGVFGQAWYLYDGLYEHRLTGKHRVPREGRREVARWILFLYTNDPYEWPESVSPFSTASLLGFLPNILALGAFSRWQVRHIAARSALDDSVWPFCHAVRVLEAARRPLFLAGVRS